MVIILFVFFYQNIIEQNTVCYIVTSLKLVMSKILMDF